jgi:hypothetical protein
MLVKSHNTDPQMHPALMCVSAGGTTEKNHLTIAKTIVQSQFTHKVITELGFSQILVQFTLYQSDLIHIFLDLFTRSLNMIHIKGCNFVKTV